MQRRKVIEMNIYLCFSIIIVAWGLNPIFTRIGSNLTDPRAYMVLLSVVSTASLLVLNTVADHQVWDKIGTLFSWKPIGIVLIDGILCMAIPSYLYNLLVSSVEHNLSVVVISTWYGAPLVTSILSHLFIGEQLSVLQMGGICVTMIGLVMINIETTTAPVASPPSEMARLL